MCAYRVVWLIVTYLLGSAGFTVTLLTVHAGNAFGLACCSAVVGSGGHILVQRARNRRPDAYQIITAGAVGAASSAALIGLVAFIGRAAIVAACILAAAAPPLFSWYARSVTALSNLWATAQIPGYIDSSTQYWPDDLAPGTSAPAASTVSVQALSDAELCLAWRTSSTALQRARTISQQHRILTARQEYLDELQRRDPPGFAHWLSAGARPASDPSKYLHNRDV